MDCDWPVDVESALAWLADDPDATLLSGGTDVMVEVSFGHRHPAHVIALRRVEELRTWEGNRIGSGVTYARLERGPITALAQLSRTVGSPQIRNAGTLAGNIATASPAGDSLPFLAAVDARIEVRSQLGGTRLVPWSDLIVGVKKNSLRPGEIITAVELPEELPEHTEFAKVGVRNAMVISMVSVCVTRRSDGATTVGLGAVGPTPIRAREAEEMISAEAFPTEAALDEFTDLVRAAVRPITDHRGTEEYRRHAAGILARRLLERCLR